MAEARVPIIIHAWHTPMQSSGFSWFVATPHARRIMRESYETDVKFTTETTEILVEFSVLWPAIDPLIVIGDWIYELLDTITTGQFGHIVARRNAPEEQAA